MWILSPEMIKHQQELDAAALSREYYNFIGPRPKRVR